VPRIPEIAIIGLQFGIRKLMLLESVTYIVFKSQGYGLLCPIPNDEKNTVATDMGTLHPTKSPVQLGSRSNKTGVGIMVEAKVTDLNPLKFFDLRDKSNEKT